MRRHRPNYWLLIAATAVITATSCSQKPGEPSAVEKALADLQDKYEELRRERGDDPVQWASEDLENLGDWEYRIEEMPGRSPGLITTRLNELGNERWEVFWVQESDGGMRFFLKRPAISYLSKIPLSQLGRYVIGEPGGE
jgi:hypothetical protein